MTENRHFAGWARILAGLFALAGLVGLTGCGGGSGSPNNPFNNPGDLSLIPNPMTVYSSTPATVTVSGGDPPYQIFSSDASTLPVQTNVSGNTTTVIPNIVSAATTLTLTVRDARGNTAQSDITVNPSPLINSLKLKADAYSESCPDSGGSANPTDDNSVTFICSGQTGTVAVRVASAVGGGLAGRAVRFDIVQGAFQLNTELPGQTPTYALTYTVPTDQNGNAVARLRAVPAAPQQVAIVQATDVATGAFVRGSFVIVSVSNANAADLVVQPTTVTITGATTLECSSNVASTFFIFGGSPPYTVSSSFPQALLISPSVVQTSGAGFTATTTGACVDPVNIIITDSAGHVVTVELHNKPGTTPPPTITSPNPINVSPSQSNLPSLACNASTNIIITGGGTVSTTGGVPSAPTLPSNYILGTDQPAALGIAPPDPAPGAVVTLTRIGNSANPTLFISDGGQVKPVTIKFSTGPGNDCT